ncbi:unnamed protein product [Prunus armeniaca]
MNRFLRLNYCICKEERTYDVDGWLAAWKASGFMSWDACNSKTLQAALPKDLEQQKLICPPVTLIAQLYAFK